MQETPGRTGGHSRGIRADRKAIRTQQTALGLAVCVCVTCSGKSRDRWPKSSGFILVTECLPDTIGFFPTGIIVLS